MHAHDYLFFALDSQSQSSIVIIMADSMAMQDQTEWHPLSPECPESQIVDKSGVSEESTMIDSSSILGMSQTITTDNVDMTDPEITRYECSLSHQPHSHRSGDMPNEAKGLIMHLKKTPKLSEASQDVDKVAYQFGSPSTAANAETMPHRPLKRVRSMISPGALCREISLSDSDLHLSSTPFHNKVRPNVRPCLDCNTRTTIEPGVTQTCMFCKLPVCEACNATPKEIMTALDPSYQQNYVYTCNNCRPILEKSQPL